MTSHVRNIAVLGSTGSIGRNALEVIAASGGALRAVALAARTNLALLEEQARSFQPAWIAATDRQAAAAYAWSGLAGTEVLVGEEALLRIVADPQVEIVLSAIVGRAGLEGTWAALEAGKTVALANKESLVVAGPLIMSLAREHRATILPVDSEHSAVFQALQAGRRSEVHKVILTASGGPFRTYSRQRLAEVTVEEALAHPTWRMGPKITIDSATLMNKALEIIEARWLFELEAEQIDVVIHPQSIVHSLVEYVDGSIVAQMSPPDMRLPIQYALTWPQRTSGIARRLDWTQTHRLEFEPPDWQQWSALRLGLEAARAGGTAGAVLSAANEAAVAAFLARQLRFDQIVPVCQQVLAAHTFEANPTLTQLLQLDGWARQEVLRWIGC